MIAITYGIWYLAVAVGNKIAGTAGSMIDQISESNGLSYFFMIFTMIPVLAGAGIVLLSPLLKKLMHGIR